MNNSLLSILLLSALALATSCKKDNANNPQPTPVVNTVKLPTDSVSFKVNNKLYIYNDLYRFGIGNMAVNVKPYASANTQGKLAYQTAGYYWFGVKDSTLYSVFYGVSAANASGNFQIAFTKRFADAYLQQAGNILKLKNNLDIIKPGKLAFALDIEKENTNEGISIDVSGNDFGRETGTKIPGFSIAVQSKLNKHIQDNSSFEITKVEKLNEENYYLVEAKFELNFYDLDEKLYRAQNGYLRLKLNFGLPGIVK